VLESTANLSARLLILTVGLVLSAGTQAKTPAGWPFVEYNEAVRIAQRTHKPMFVYFGFPTCPYCEIANKNTFSFDTLRKRYTEHYVLAYFDIRGNPSDVMTMPSGDKLTRDEANKRLRSAPVPAWMFVSPEGKEILMRRGSRTPVEAFMQFDQYVSSGAYKRGSFESFLAQQGQQEAKPPE
jgi:thioredoxin-related protein